MLPKSLFIIIITLFSALQASTSQVPFILPSSVEFQLRHLHAVANTSQILFSDVHSSSTEGLMSDTETSYLVNTTTIGTYRPSSFAAHSRARQGTSRRSGTCSELDSDPLTWIEDRVLAPDVTSREALLELAKMTNNAYAYPGSPDNQRPWYDLDDKWNSTFPFGWEDDQDGFRGHIFATTDNSTVVISIKGSSLGLFGGGGPTSRKDKLNDNLLFSCCCARVDFTWTPVCGCYAGGDKCDQDCLEASLIEDSLFYPLGTNLYNNVTYMYPNSTIWLIGHSLGGALASLIGATFGAPVVTFECPGEKMAAERLHLPSPPSTQHLTHVYHTADPIAMGTCNGILSSCAFAGYAMESRCHLGKSIIYDTVTQWDWAIDIRTHPIQVIIDRLLDVEWNKTFPPGGDNEPRDPPVPIAKPEENCVECYSWRFGKFLDPGDW